MDLLEKFLESMRKRETVAEATLNMYKKDIEDFRIFLGEKNYEIADSEDIMQYIKFMETKYLENSIIRKLSSIKNFYKFLLKNEIIEISPAEEISITRKFIKNTDKIELNELRDIINSCEDNGKGRRDRIIIKLLAETGMQITEILNLKISEMEKTDYSSFIVKTSTEYIIVELSKESADELHEYVKKYRNTVVKEKDIADDKIFCDLSIQNFRARFMKYGVKAGIEREVQPSMIKNRCQHERREILQEKKEDFQDRIREEYFRIGIGDD